jgi:hypothetical protein
MKKLITLTFALLFSAGIAFGQNSATTNQSGNNNSAKVAQHNSGNEATITQDGNKNTVQKMNQTYISNNDASGINVAYVSQVGNRNTIKNNGNFDGAIQAGASNSFSVDQDGKGNVVENIHQGTNSNLSTNGTMDITQGHNAPGEDIHNSYNYVYHADQFGNDNHLTVTQTDEDHVYVQAQVSKGLVGNTINIHQLSWDSKVGHKDNGHGSGGYGAYQQGSDNSMDITQGAWAAAGTQKVEDVFSNAPYDNAGGQSLVQFGKSNSLTIDQAGSSYGYGSNGHYGDNEIGAVLQNGYLNHASITQGLDVDATANLMQRGYNNGATIDQNGAGGTATIMQNGASNTSTITQN